MLTSVSISRPTALCYHGAIAHSEKNRAGLASRNKTESDVINRPYEGHANECGHEIRSKAASKHENLRIHINDRAINLTSPGQILRGSDF